MELEGRKIGFALTGSRSTMILIQLNDLRGLRTGWVQNGCIFLFGCKKAYKHSDV